ncbi:MAG: sensor histidine kinase [Anaerolineales bacterium]|nr:sensor histidine kinase [Anaerolineales bacterium]MCB8983688.1 sensor histidine kinase [Ardenticatenaceae bacterium]
MAQQYMLVSLLVMLGGMLVIGLWISKQIETAVSNRTAAVTALYVDSYISPHLQGLTQAETPAGVDVPALERLLVDTSLGEQIVSFKVWSPDGVILYSPNPDLIGQQFAIEGGLAEAFEGAVITEVSDLEKPEQAYERQFWNTLIETYAPSRAAGSGDIIAVSEFYQTSDALEAEIRSAQYRSWLVVAVVMTAVYILLAGLVGSASSTIVSQQERLQENVTQLHGLLGQNQQLHGRIRRAAARTTALNEQYLRRISADIHDGPAQDLALALLRIEPLADAVNHTPEAANDFQTVQTAMESAMTELRTISAGLRLPEIENSSITETVQRAIYDFETKTGSQVVITLGLLPQDAPIPVKITLFRIIKEALANSYRHANSSGQTVHVYEMDGSLQTEISDAGQGFDPTAVPGGHLGLVAMRERVELLGGQFEVHSQPGSGTTIRAVLPISTTEVNDV